MKNYINVRLQTTNHKKTINDIKHNLGINKSMNQKNNNQNFNFSPSGKILNDKDMIQILDDYKQDREIHSQQFQEFSKTNLKIRDRNSTWLNGIFSFSESVEVKMGTQEEIDNKIEKTFTYIDEKTKEEITIKGIPEYTIEDMRKTSLAAANDLAKHLGVSLKYISEHNNEERIHYQYHLENFKIGQKNTVFFEHRKTTELSVIQDLGHKHFSKLGMDRGIKKDINTPNYQTTQSYYENKIREQQLENEVLKNTNKDLLSDNLSQIEINKQLIKDNIIARKEVSKLDLSRVEKQTEQKRFTAVNKQLSQSNKDLLSENKVIIKIQKEEERRIDEKSLELDNKFVESIELVEVLENGVESKKNEYEELNKNIEIKKEEESRLNKNIDYLSKGLIRENELKISNKLLDKDISNKKNKIDNLEDEYDEVIIKKEKQIEELEDKIKKLDKSDMEELIVESVDSILEDKDNHKGFGKLKVLDKVKLQPDLINAIRQITKIDIYDNDIKKIESKLENKYIQELDNKDNIIKELESKIENLTIENSISKESIEELKLDFKNKIDVAVESSNEVITNKYIKLIDEINQENKIKENKSDNIIYDLNKDITSKDREVVKLNINIKENTDKINILEESNKELKDTLKHKEGLVSKITDLESNLIVAEIIYPDITSKIFSHQLEISKGNLPKLKSDSVNEESADNKESITNNKKTKEHKTDKQK